MDNSVMFFSLEILPKIHYFQKIFFEILIFFLKIFKICLQGMHYPAKPFNRTSTLLLLPV